MAFRNFAALELPESLAIPTCTNCGEEWLDAETTEALERSLADTASKALTSLSIEAIAVLAEHSAQRDLEDLLDLSHGYLSKVKHGKEKPSALLAALLALLAKDPEQRLGEVRNFWSTKTLGLPRNTEAAKGSAPSQEASSPVIAVE